MLRRTNFFLYDKWLQFWVELITRQLFLYFLIFSLFNPFISFYIFLLLHIYHHHFKINLKKEKKKKNTNKIINYPNSLIHSKSCILTLPILLIHINSFHKKENRERKRKQKQKQSYVFRSSLNFYSVKSFDSSINHFVDNVIRSFFLSFIRIPFHFSNIFVHFHERIFFVFLFFCFYFIHNKHIELYFHT